TDSATSPHFPYTTLFRSKTMRKSISTRLELHSVDVLAEDFQLWLTQQLAGSQRPVVIAEGLLGYFSMQERESLASAVAGALASRSEEHTSELQSRENLVC